MRPQRRICRTCGVTVLHAPTEDEGLVVLDLHESAGGPNRYVVWDDGIARPISRRREVTASARHTCPVDPS